MTIQQMIVDAANRYGVPPNIALGVAAHESGFNPSAVNTSNPNGTRDWGVMQLNDTTIATMGVSNPLDPAQNIDAGVRLLSNLLSRYGGDTRSALWAYASGPGNVGPTKTPNSIAQGFINYVSSYNSGTIPVESALPEPSDPFAGLDPFSTDTPGSVNSYEASSVDWGMIGLFALGGWIVWMIFKD